MVHYVDPQLDILLKTYNPKEFKGEAMQMRNNERIRQDPNAPNFFHR
jgi:hypothetical protein